MAVIVTADGHQVLPMTDATASIYGVLVEQACDADRRARDPMVLAAAMMARVEVVK